MFGVGIRFRGGDGARVHLRDCPGGGLRCAARCRGCSTHSRPQVTSAGAKPNHGFFGCQQPVAKKFRPAAGAGGGGGRATCAQHRRYLRRRLPVEGTAYPASRKKTPCFMQFVRATRNGGAATRNAARAMRAALQSASRDAESRRSGRPRRKRRLRVATARLRQSAQEFPSAHGADDSRSTLPRRPGNPIRQRCEHVVAPASPAANATASRRRQRRFSGQQGRRAIPKQIRPHMAAGPERQRRATAQWSSSSSSSA